MKNCCTAVSALTKISFVVVTLLLQCVQEAEAVQLELKACCLWLLLQLLSMLLHPLQCWLQVVSTNLQVYTAQLVAAAQCPDLCDRKSSMQLEVSCSCHVPNPACAHNALKPNQILL